MDGEKLTQSVKLAQEATKDITDDVLRKAAFEIILRKLLDSESGSVKPIGRARKTKTASPARSSAELDETTQKLCSLVNRTKYPEIYMIPKALGKSLFILKLARDELGIDGLTPAQIAKVLMKNFRVKIASNAVSMALMAAGTLVDRKTLENGGTGYRYYIMRGGEEHLRVAISELDNITGENTENDSHNRA